MHINILFVNLFSSAVASHSQTLLYTKYLVVIIPNTVTGHKYLVHTPHSSFYKTSYNYYKCAVKDRSYKHSRIAFIKADAVNWWIEATSWWPNTPACIILSCSWLKKAVSSIINYLLYTVLAHLFTPLSSMSDQVTPSDSMQYMIIWKLLCRISQPLC